MVFGSSITFLVQRGPDTKMSEKCSAKMNHRNPSAKKAPGQVGSGRHSIKEEITAILHKLFWKIREVGMLPSAFYKARITLKPTVKKTLQKGRSLAVS